MMAAWLLAEAGLDVTTLLLGAPEKLAGDAAIAWSELTQPMRGKVYVVTSAQELASHRDALTADLIVDAVLGTGFKPPLKGMALVAIEWLRKSHAPVLAVDLPSGWPADETGAMASGAVFPADAVITFTAPKPAHVFGSLTRRWDQPIVVAPIGSPEAAIVSRLGIDWAGSSLALAQTPRAAAANKGNFGHVLVVGEMCIRDSWYRFQQDTGLQAEWTDPINSIFNSYSPQPQRTLVAGYTHIFSVRLVNQFNPGASWYSSIFEPNNYSQALEAFPIVLASGSDSVPFTTIGGLNDTFPQGRKVTQWQINDSLTWTRGRHTLHFGVNTRRVDTSDYDLGEGTVPTVAYNDLAEFTFGAAFTAQQNFPVSLKERVAVGNLEYYGMDTWKPDVYKRQQATDPRESKGQEAQIKRR